MLGNLDERALEQQGESLHEKLMRKTDPATGRAIVGIDSLGGGSALAVLTTPTGFEGIQRHGADAIRQELAIGAITLDPIKAELVEQERYASVRRGGFRRVYKFGTSEYIDQ